MKERKRKVLVWELYQSKENSPKLMFEVKTRHHRFRRTVTSPWQTYPFKAEESLTCQFLFEIRCEIKKLNRMIECYIGNYGWSTEDHVKPTPSPRP